MKGAEEAAEMPTYPLHTNVLFEELRKAALVLSTAFRTLSLPPPTRDPADPNIVILFVRSRLIVFSLTLSSSAHHLRAFLVSKPFTVNIQVRCVMINIVLAAYLSSSRIDGGI